MQSQFEGKYGFIDLQNQMVIPQQYDNAYSFNEGLAAVAKKDANDNLKWGFINPQGKLVIPMQFDDVSYITYDTYGFDQGLAAVSKNGKYGYIDKMGKTVIPFKYDSAWTFSEGLAPVMIGSSMNGQTEKWGFIDKTGKLVIPAIYQSLEGDGAEGYYEFINGKARVIKGDKEICINKQNKTIKCDN